MARQCGALAGDWGAPYLQRGRHLQRRDNASNTAQLNFNRFSDHVDRRVSSAFSRLLSAISNVCPHWLLLVGREQQWWTPPSSTYTHIAQLPAESISDDPSVVDARISALPVIAAQVFRSLTPRPLTASWMSWHHIQNAAHTLNYHIGVGVANSSCRAITTRVSCAVAPRRPCSRLVGTWKTQ